ncbi:MAG: VanZ family protein [Lachnospiraceae bacterium]|nr:VanZ family protein [Lachnospiraceae bacterium]
MNKLKKILSFIPLLLCIMMIFGFSSQNGSQSGSMSRKIAKKIIATEENMGLWSGDDKEYSLKVEDVNEKIRIMGHAGEHALLMFSFFVPVTVILKKDDKRLRFPLRLAIAFVCTVLCACLDELHQTFVRGRVGDPLDVLVDSIGAAIMGLAITLINVIHGLLSKKRA